MLRCGKPCVLRVHIGGQGKMVGDSFMEGTSKQRPKAITQVNVCVCACTGVGVKQRRTFRESKGCKCLEWTQESEEIQDVGGPCLRGWTL